MSEFYTKSSFVVGVQYPSGTWNLYSGCDNLQAALQDFNNITPDTHANRYKAAAIFTRGQWHSQSGQSRYFKALRDNNDPIPSSIGMWIVNQADSGYF